MLFGIAGNLSEEDLQILFGQKNLAWWLSTGPYGYIAATGLKTILKEILKVDRRVFHTWKSPAEMRIWFDLNKVADMSRC